MPFASALLVGTAEVYAPHRSGQMASLQRMVKKLTGDCSNPFKGENEMFRTVGVLRHCISFAYMLCS